MKKIILGILIGLGISASVLVSAKYLEVPDYATRQQIAEISYKDYGVYRFEWFGDVCYEVIRGASVSALSCVKK